LTFCLPTKIVHPIGLTIPTVSVSLINRILQNLNTAGLFLQSTASSPAQPVDITQQTFALTKRTSSATSTDTGITYRKVKRKKERKKEIKKGRKKGKKQRKKEWKKGRKKKRKKKERKERKKEPNCKWRSP